MGGKKATEYTHIHKMSVYDSLVVQLQPRTPFTGFLFENESAGNTEKSVGDAGFQLIKLMSLASFS